MPKRAKLSKNGSTLAQELKRGMAGTDSVKVGSLALRDSEVRAGSMADVMKQVDGIRYLVPNWVPFGMTTMLVAEPGVGKSALALDGLSRPIITGCNWFNGTKGPAEPGRVLWCDTEGTAAITIQRIKDWKLPPKRIKVPWEDDVLRSVNLASDKDLAQIEAVVSKYETRLVVIDSLRGAHDGDENNSRVAGCCNRWVV